MIDRALRARLDIIAEALDLPPSEVMAALTSERALIEFAARYNQSLDWLMTGNLIPMIRARARQSGSWSPEEPRP